MGLGSAAGLSRGKLGTLFAGCAEDMQEQQSTEHGALHPPCISPEQAQELPFHTEKERTTKYAKQCW